MSARLLLASLLVLVAIGCAARLPNYQGSTSQTKDISIVIPGMDAFTQEKSLQALLTGYKLTIYSATESCNHKTPYIARLTDLKMTTQILKNCDYTISLEVGGLAPDGLNLAEAFFVGQSTLTKEEIKLQVDAGKPAVGVDMMLNVSDAGKTRGFDKSVKIETANVDINVKVNNPVPPDNGLEIKDYPIKYKPAVDGLEQPALTYIEIMNKLDYVAANDPVKYALYAKYLKRVWTFDMYYHRPAMDMPESKYIYFLPITVEGKAGLTQSYPNMKFKMSAGTRDLAKFQALTDLVKTLKPGDIVRVNVDLYSIYDSSLGGDLLEISKLK